MEINTFRTKEEMGKAAAKKASETLRRALEEKRTARFVAATGASQFEFLSYLAREGGIDWSRTEMFHLDEYVGIDEGHPASFRRYLKERLIEKVRPGAVHLLRGESPDPQNECRRVGAIISKAPIDVAFAGIGENGHLAFNDPPADFQTEDPYIVVELDSACRRQQVGEGWFSSLEEVPERAISMSIKQIMKSEVIICTIPDKRKAEAVGDCFGPESKVTPEHPASVLKEHPSCHVFLDKDSASLLGL